MATPTALASASSSPVTAGPFQDALGNVVANGKLVFDLSQAAAVSGGGEVAPTRVKITLDSNGKVSAGQSMYRTTDLSPSGLTYRMQLFDTNGNFLADFGNQAISGAAPIDLALLTPTSNSGSVISFSNAVLLNPTGQQTINGFPLVIEGSSLGFSAASSTTGDAFVNRQASGNISIGTTASNTSGTLQAATITANTTLQASISGAGTGGSGAPAQIIATTTPGLSFEATGGSANNKWWDILPNTSSLSIRAVNDANNAAGSAMTITRGSGAAIGAITFGANGNTQTLFTSTDQIVGRNTTDIFTNKTISDTLFINRLRATQGTVLTSGDFSLSAGWGNTASITGVVGTDQAFSISILSNGAGISANPTVTLTFKNGTWSNSPISVVGRGDASGSTGGNGIFAATGITTTQLTVTFISTPTAGNSYTFYCISIGR